jgi:hypothetical protein
MRCSISNAALRRNTAAQELFEIVRDGAILLQAD